jgi:hypothetical protein
MPAITCDPATVAKASACWCTDEATYRASMLFLLRQIAGNTMTPAQLAAAAACYVGIPEDVWRAEVTMLLCSISTAEGA